MIQEFEGINLRAIKYSENSIILHVISPKKGRICILCKGARSSTRGLQARLRPFEYNNYICSQKSGLPLLYQAELKESFFSLTKEIERVEYAYHLLTVLDRISQPDLPEPELFESFLQALRECRDEKIDKLNESKEKFKNKILKSQGLFTDKMDSELLLQQYIGKELKAL